MRSLRALVLIAIAAGLLPAVSAQEQRPVAEQMRRLFAARLKADVGLDDAQVAAVLPKIESLERARLETARQRRRLVRELRHGLESGMSDTDLQERLGALDRLGQDGERLTRAALEDVDRDLTVPQRVRVRFLLVQFRDEMRLRVESLREGGAGPRRQRRTPPAGPPP
jgi:HEAT repeat protein